MQALLFCLRCWRVVASISKCQRQRWVMSSKALNKTQQKKVIFRKRSYHLKANNKKHSCLTGVFFCFKEARLLFKRLSKMCLMIFKPENFHIVCHAGGATKCVPRCRRGIFISWFFLQPSLPHFILQAQCAKILRLQNQMDKAQQIP